MSDGRTDQQAPDRTAVLAAVDAAVLAVDGVTDLYRARPTVGSALQTIRRIGSLGDAVRSVLDGTVLRVVIGTDGVRPAPEVARAAHAAALAVARTAGIELTRVDVRVALVG